MIELAALFALFASAPEDGECFSCHATTATIALHAELLPKHPKQGCVVCHNGNGTAREKNAAHGSGPEELLARERTQASCVACHIAGAVPGTEFVVRGGRVALEKGCSFCHLGARGLGYEGAFAPPLAGIAARGTPYLRDMIRTPKKTFPATVMPAYHLPEAEEAALLVYLLSLRAEVVPPKQPGHSTRRCASCHQTKTVSSGLKVSEDPQLKEHRCAWIKAERATLSCKSCHARGVPTSTAECLYIRQRRKECGTCHEGGIDGR